MAAGAASEWAPPNETVGVDGAACSRCLSFLVEKHAVRLLGARALLWAPLAWLSGGGGGVLQVVLLVGNGDHDHHGAFVVVVASAAAA